MNKKLISTALIINTLSFPLHAKTGLSDTSLDMSVDLYGVSVEETQIDAKVIGARIGMNGRYKVFESLDSFLEIGAYSETGSNNAQFIDEYAPNKGVSLRNAGIAWTPIRFFKLEAGALSQRRIKNPLLVGSSAFASAAEKIIIPFTQDHRLFIEAQQSIPNNQNLTERIGQVNKGSPQFLHNQAGIELDGNVLNAQASVGMWKYSELSSSVAYNSLFLGNSTNGGDSTSSRFTYDFEGLSAQGSLNYTHNETYGFQISGSYVYNDKAPEGRNKGHLFTLALGMHDQFFGIETFSNESDSSVAFYNSKSVGHNNKEGTSLFFKGKLKSKDLDYRIRWTEMKRLRSSLYQNDTSRIDFKITKAFNIL
ncbi:MAG: hypothetical protein GY909_09415 [Oligoflexia bacterium]|nr:hypothetical protein [Oligoflexia bacterium]